MPNQPDRYNAYAYPAFSYPNTHPDHLATMAILHGLTPAPVERCRVLEVACGEGANLIPMAYAIPGSEFVGFDLAHLPVERGQARIRELGLGNIRIFQGDLLKIGADLGRFDYIIAHGLYSWVPEHVRDRLISFCSEVLAPDGIAFVSYNALPGSYLRLVHRDMLMFRARHFDDPEQGVLAGIDFLRFISQTRKEGDPYRAYLEDQLERMESHPHATTYHDELSPEYHPAYFTDFVAHAHRHGLEYVCDSEIPPTPDPSYRPDIQQTVEEASGGDFIKKEQIFDFSRMRPYRETLLCKAGRPVRREYFPESFSSLLLASEATSRPGEKPGAQIFELAAGAKMETNHPAVVWLLQRLGQAWPRALSVRELLPSLEERGVRLDTAGALLLMRLIISKMVEPRAWNAPLAPAVSERPRASAYTRLAARQGIPAATLLHITLELDDPKVRSLVTKLDGTRTRSELLHALQAEFPDATPAAIEEGLDPSLRIIHLAGALEA
jgi:SAM-dependent methyltransferase